MILYFFLSRSRSAMFRFSAPATRSLHQSLGTISTNARIRMGSSSFSSAHQSSVFSVLATRSISHPNLAFTRISTSTRIRMGSYSPSSSLAPQISIIKMFSSSTKPPEAPKLDESDTKVTACLKTVASFMRSQVVLPVPLVLRLFLVVVLTCVIILRDLVYANVNISANETLIEIFQRKWQSPYSNSCSGIVRYSARSLALSSRVVL